MQIDQAQVFELIGRLYAETRMQAAENAGLRQQIDRLQRRVNEFEVAPEVPAAPVADGAE